MNKVVAGLILNDDGHLLLQLRDEKKGIRSPGVWSLPGGFRNDAETSIEALKREIYEETNLKLLNPFYIGTLIDIFEGLPYISIDFYIERIIPPYKLEVNEGQDLKFFDLSDISKLNIRSHVNLMSLYAIELFNTNKST